MNASVSASDKKTSGIARYSDFLLAGAVVAILGLMVLPLNTLFIDFLVAINICCGIGLLLVAIYIPSPVAFSSFPSVLLIYTLFRLALSIATTRLILVEANGGHVIQTFGEVVAGGSLVVGVVVFIIITIVQFIVVAKGAERVAEVAARFTLDAMPGKQLSIDSDLRAGLIDKDEAKRRRKNLEIESQLHGSLDGAMKFVKGDAIAGIIIICVNLIGGIAVGVLRDGMSISVAVHTFSILTIGDGLVTQIPALLGAISAGLIVTRTVGDERDSHLGEAVTRQILSQKKVMLVTGLMAILLALVPGFPIAIFLGLSLTLLTIALYQSGNTVKDIPRIVKTRSLSSQESVQATQNAVEQIVPIKLVVSQDISESIGFENIQRVASNVRQLIHAEIGVPVPSIKVEAKNSLSKDSYRIELFGTPAYSGELKKGYRTIEFKPGITKIKDEWEKEIGNPIRSDLPLILVGGSTKSLEIGDGINLLDTDESLSWILNEILKKNAAHLLGIQEANALVTRLNLDCPELVKEVLRVIPLQRLSEVMKRLIDEGLSISNLRDLFESLADAGQREKDIGMLAEYGRIGLRREICHQYASPDRIINAVTLAPNVENLIIQTLRANSAVPPAIDPAITKQLIASLEKQIFVHPTRLVLLTPIEIRRHVRKLIEYRLPSLPVLSYQELTGDIKVQVVNRVPLQASNDGIAPQQDRRSLSEKGLSLSAAE
jgi:type III secretion protein V